MAGEQQDVLVADRPEIRDGTVFSLGGEDVAFDEIAEIDPAPEIL